MIGVYINNFLVKRYAKYDGTLARMHASLLESKGYTHVHILPVL